MTPVTNDNSSSVAMETEPRWLLRMAVKVSVWAPIREVTCSKRDIGETSHKKGGIYLSFDL